MLDRAAGFAAADGWHRARPKAWKKFAIHVAFSKTRDSLREGWTRYRPKLLIFG